MGKQPLNKKKAIRDMRKGIEGRENPDGSRSTHVMGWVGDPSKKRGEFGVYPTIAPKPGKEKSTDPEDWYEQSPKEAEEKGEMINVSSRRKAERLAAGSWKQGQERKEAMKDYREDKIEEAYRKRLEASDNSTKGLGSYPEVTKRKKK